MIDAILKILAGAHMALTWIILFAGALALGGWILDRLLVVVFKHLKCWGMMVEFFFYRRRFKAFLAAIVKDKEP